jgi:hypothetical protein
MVLLQQAAIADGGRNLLVDGSFESLKQSQLSKNWYVETSDVFEGAQSLRFTANEAASGWDSSGYVQTLPVDAAHMYAVSVTAKSIDLTGPNGPKYNAYMVLKYYDKEGRHIPRGSAGGSTWWRGGWDKWIPHVNYISPPENAVEARLEPMVYQCSGTTVIDAISICDLGPAPEPRTIMSGDKTMRRVPTPEAHKRPDFTAVQKEQGFVTFVRNEPGFIFPQSYPRGNEVTDTVRRFAAQGQYSSAGFAIYPLVSLQNVRVEVGDLRSPNGETIDRSNVTLRRVRYWPQKTSISGGNRFVVLPEILEPMKRTGEGDVDSFFPLATEYDLAEGAWKNTESALLEAHIPHQFWISIDTPTDAEPGTYSADIRIHAADLPSNLVTIELKVLSFALKRPRRFQGFYLYDHRYDDLTDRQLHVEFKELKRFGTESVLVALASYEKLGRTDGSRFIVDDVAGRKRIVTMESRRLERILDAFNEAGMKGPFIIGFDPMISREVARVLGRPKEEGADMREWSPAVHEGLVDAFRATDKVMRKYGLGGNWGMALKDEAQSPYTRHIQQEAALAKKAGILTFLTSSIKMGNEVADDLDILCFPRLYDGAQTPQRLKWCEDNDVSYWYYQGGAYTGQGGKVFPNRFCAGFQLIKSGAKCHMAYTFQDGRVTCWNEFETPNNRSWNTTYPLIPEIGWVEESFISTLQWEGIKEGFYDACYYATLSDYIGQAEALGAANLTDDIAKAKATQREVLDETPWGILTHYGYPGGPLSRADTPKIGFHNGEAERLRTRLAEEIIRLGKKLSAYSK